MKFMRMWRAVRGPAGCTELKLTGTFSNVESQPDGGRSSGAPVLTTDIERESRDCVQPQAFLTEGLSTPFDSFLRATEYVAAQCPVSATSLVCPVAQTV